jgi:hypothetical protein
MIADGWTPPSPTHPFWRDAAGSRVTVQATLAETPPAERAAVLERHAEGICAIVHLAGSHRAAGRVREARALASHASRLCGELAGLWPAGSQEPLR